MPTFQQRATQTEQQQQKKQKQQQQKHAEACRTFTLLGLPFHPAICRLPRRRRLHLREVLCKERLLQPPLLICIRRAAAACSARGLRLLPLLLHSLALIG